MEWSDGDEFEPAVEATEIIRIRGNHPRSRSASDDRHRRINHIVATGHSAELPGGSSLSVVEYEHFA